MAATPGTPRFAYRGFESFGAVEPTQGISFTTPSGAGFEAQSGKKHDWVRMENTRGSGFFSMTPTTSGQGDGKTAIENKKGTNSFMTQSGDKSKPSITGFGNADNSAITIDSGGGRPATINMATGTGLCSFTMTDAAGGSISARVGEAQWTLTPQFFKTTYHLIQEMINNAAELKKYQQDIQKSLREALKPYSDKCDTCGGDGQSSDGSGCNSCGSTGVSGSAPTGVSAAASGVHPSGV